MLLLLQLTVQTRQARGGPGHRALSGRWGWGLGMCLELGTPPEPGGAVPGGGEASWSRAQPFSWLQHCPRWGRAHAGFPSTPEEGFPPALPQKEWSEEAGWDRKCLHPKRDVPWVLAHPSRWPNCRSWVIFHFVFTKKISKAKQIQEHPFKTDLKRKINIFFMCSFS